MGRRAKIPLLLGLWAVLSGFSVLGQDDRQGELQAAFSELPACERQVINKRLKTVKFSTDMKYPMWGDSYGFGLTKLNDELEGALMIRVFYHETGHFFDWGLYPRPSENPAFAKAVADDFAAMTPKQVKANWYLETPKEAWAELFSQHFIPLTYGDTDQPYELNLLPRAEAQFLKELDAQCPTTSPGE